MTFSSQARKARVVFAAADLLLTAIAFHAAYLTRLSLQLEHNFAIPEFSLVLAFCALTWMASGWWLDVYHRMGGSGWRIVIRDSLRQATLGTLCLLIFEFILRLDLSRLFLGLFAVYRRYRPRCNPDWNGRGGCEGGVNP